MGTRILPEAIVFLLDVGQHMGQLANEHNSFFDQSISCVEKIFQRKIFAESKDEIALVLFGTQDTKNRLAQNGQYLNITEAKSLQMTNWDHLEYIQNTHLSSTSADFIDALIVALNLLVEETRGKKFSLQKIVLFSNFVSEFSTDQIDVIIKGISNARIELNVVGPDLDDENNDDSSDNYGNVCSNFRQKQEAEKIIKLILKETNGESYSFEEAIPSLSFFQKKNIRSVPWKVLLDVGPNLQIPVLSYLKTSPCKLKTWKNMYSRDEDVPLITAVSYHINDEGQTEVEKDDCIPAYKYGKTLVPFSKEDQINMKYKSPGKCLSVLGCTESCYLKRQNYLGESVRIVVADSSDEPASMALSAIIHALHETNCVLIVRYCYSVSSNPKLGFLLPKIKTNSEYFLFGLLPFMEDLRHYTFAPLNAKQKNIPNEKQLQLIDDLITSMNLEITNEDGEEEELLKPKRILNPFFQRLYQSLCYRALHPEEPLPDTESHILQTFNPPEEILSKSTAVMEEIKRNFPLEDTGKRKKLKTGAEAFKDSGNNPSLNDISTEGGLADMSTRPITEIGTITPVNDFQALVNQPGIIYTKIFKQMQDIIMKLIMDCPGQHFYIKAIDCIKALREQEVKNYTDDYNNFLRHLKLNVQFKKKEFWNLMIKENLGLITTDENPSSLISKEEGLKYFETDVTTALDEAVDDLDDVDDLLANM